MRAPASYWSVPVAAVLAALDATPLGLASEEAARRLRETGPNVVEPGRPDSVAALLLRQFASPLVLILVFGAVVSAGVGDWLDASIILVIVAGSTMLGFWQEYRGSQAVAALRSRLALTSRVWRDGRPAAIPLRDVVPGDVVDLSAGNMVPGDGVVLDARDFLVNEATLTGESLPVEKSPGIADRNAPLALRANCVSLGSSVRSGMARVLVVATGRDTGYGGIAAKLGAAVEEGEFARGLRAFGYLLLRVMVVMIVAVMVANHALHRPVLESLLFAVALAVGLSPELLPAIVSVTLSKGARAMAERGVIVRRLEAIENLGSIDVLCTDKTGTLTMGTMALAAVVDPSGAASPDAARLAYLNAALETGIENPLDAAIIAAGAAAGWSAEGAEKVDEIPYDFVRRRLTIVVAEAGGKQHRMITKGAVRQVLDVCVEAAGGAEAIALDADARSRLEAYAA
ncbi:MAG: HAD-IC family P-type ATPase, partial [Betaproteobacteria bacterium]|nr:HAD-IC family P-type ATPase [Betaproteobacteria bacterium]